MGLPATVQGLVAITPPPVGDQASSVLSGTLGAVGPSLPWSVVGPFNVSIYGTVNTTLTTAGGGTVNATVGSGTGLAAGGAINSSIVPPGTTWATFSGTSGTLALPTYSLPGVAPPGTAEFGVPVIKNLGRTNGLVGATIAGPGIPANTTGTKVLVAAQSVPNMRNQGGVLQISNTPTIVQPNTFHGSVVPPTVFTFALASAAVLGAGSDANAIFTGAGTTFSGTVQIERSFDGGFTWIVANSGGAGALAQFTAGTPVSLAFGEPERGVLYRVNCIAYTSGTIAYRFSTTGAANMALGINQLT